MPNPSTVVATTGLIAGGICALAAGPAFLLLSVPFLVSAASMSSGYGPDKFDENIYQAIRSRDVVKKRGIDGAVVYEFHFASYMDTCFLTDPHVPMPRGTSIFRVQFSDPPHVNIDLRQLSSS
jgi:hypothetical protein